MTKNHGNPDTYAKIVDRFGLKAKQRDGIDTMDPAMFVNLMAAAEAGDWSMASRVLAAADIILA